MYLCSRERAWASLSMLFRFQRTRGNTALIRKNQYCIRLSQPKADAKETWKNRLRALCRVCFRYAVFPFTPPLKAWGLHALCSGSTRLGSQREHVCFSLALHWVHPCENQNRSDSANKIQPKTKDIVRIWSRTTSFQPYTFVMVCLASRKPFVNYQLSYWIKITVPHIGDKSDLVVESFEMLPVLRPLHSHQKRL